MKLNYIALQCLRDYAVAFLAHIGIASGCRESHGIHNGIFCQVLGSRNDIIQGHAGENLLKYNFHYIVNH